MIKFPTFDDDVSSKIETKVKYITIDAIVSRVFEKKRSFYDLKKQKKQLSELLQTPPNQNETVRFLSSKDGFSSIGFISYIADLEKIEELNVSTFRIGVKQAQELVRLHTTDRLESAFFITGRIKSIQSDKYDYFTQIDEMFSKIGFKMIEVSNHSKVILMKTKNNRYVVETSSNLNENPSIEQFIFSNNDEVYDFYHQFFLEVKLNGGQIQCLIISLELIDI